MKPTNIFAKLSAVIAARSRKKLRAATRTAPRSAMDSYEADEPGTNLSGAFIVVLVLHVVAVAGIYAFNSIKAARTSQGTASAPVAEMAKPAVSSVPKPPAPAPSTANPAPAKTVETLASLTPSLPPPASKPASGKQYQVKAGDNPTKIAVAFNLKTEELLAANNLKADAVLHPGQMLAIPTPKPAVKPVAADAHKTDAPAKQSDVPPTRTTPGLHIVKKGDTATSIAKVYGFTAEEILKVNKGADAKKLQPGQALKIPVKKG